MKKTIWGVIAPSDRKFMALHRVRRAADRNGNDASTFTAGVKKAPYKRARLAEDDIDANGGEHRRPKKPHVDANGGEHRKARIERAYKNKEISYDRYKRLKDEQNEALNEAKAPSHVQRFKAAMETHGGPHFDTVGKNKDGHVVGRRQFFYTHGNTSEKLAHSASEALHKAGIKHTVVDHTQHNAGFRGGAGVKQNSHWAVHVKLHDGVDEAHTINQLYQAANHHRFMHGVAMKRAEAAEKGTGDFDAKRAPRGATKDQIKSMRDNASHQARRKAAQHDKARLVADKVRWGRHSEHERDLRRLLGRPKTNEAALDDKYKGKVQYTVAPDDAAHSDVYLHQRRHEGLDELKRSTLASYVKKASYDMAGAGMDWERPKELRSDKHKKGGALHTMTKRWKGIKKAADLAETERSLDELHGKGSVLGIVRHHNDKANDAFSAGRKIKRLGSAKRDALFRRGEYHDSQRRRGLDIHTIVMAKSAKEGLPRWRKRVRDLKPKNESLDEAMYRPAFHGEDDRSKNEYKVVRMHKSDKADVTIKRGLTLSQAQSHCRHPDTSSRTATSKAAKDYHKRHGDFFDGYDEDKRTK